MADREDLRMAVAVSSCTKLTRIQLYLNLHWVKMLKNPDKKIVGYAIAFTTLNFHFFLFGLLKWKRVPF